MPVTSEHPKYKYTMEDVTLVRHCLEGQRKIKEEGDLYLPVPPGMQQAVGTGSRYEFYKELANFPELCGPMLQGIQGLIHEKPPEIELPAGLAYLEDKATVNGETLTMLWERITREIMAGGRIELLAEVSRDIDDRFRFCDYCVEDMINWRLDPIAYGGRPSLVVFKECFWSERQDDPFESEEVQQYRELRMVDGAYAVRMWRISDGKPMIWVPEDIPGADVDDGGWVFPGRRGATIDHIPITVINASHNGFQYGTIPMLPFSRISVSIYRLHADYRRSLYVKSDPQYVLFGVAEEDAPKYIGGNSIWCIENQEASAQVLDIDGLGIPLQREAINDEYDRFYEHGGRLFDTSDRPAESGRALQMRSQNEQVTIKSALTHAAEGVEEAIRDIGRMSGIDEQTLLDGVRFAPNMDFAEPRLTADEVRAVLETWTAGHISRKTVHRRLELGDMTDTPYEQEQEEIQEDQMNGLGPVVPTVDMDPAQADEDEQENRRNRDQNQQEEETSDAS